MPSTTDRHPTVLAAEKIIERAADYARMYWHHGSESTKPYGVPEAVAQAAGDDLVGQVVAERQLVTFGIDVWWNDLLCEDGEQAARELLALRSIDPQRLYGDMHEANLGLLELCRRVTVDQLNAIGNIVTHVEVDAFIECVEVARAYDRATLLAHLCEDIHYSVPHATTTPAGVRRRLRGIRGLECVAAHHVLKDVLPLGTAQVLVGPVAKVLLPMDLSF